MRIFVASIIAYIAPFSGFCQQIETTSDSMEVANYPIRLYKEATILTQNLYNGRLYYLMDPRAEEHQFFRERKWVDGSVFYDGQKFEGVKMMYDLVIDNLVIRHLYGENMLLRADLIKYFDMDGHHYERLISGVNINPTMATGFYDIVHQGPSKTIIKRRKDRQEKIVDKSIIPLYLEKDFYFIYRNGVYNEVRTKKSVLYLFEDKKRELRRWLRSHRMLYRKQREEAIIGMATLYDQLTQK